MKKFKVIKTTHPISTLVNKEAYAIVCYPYYITDSGIIKGAYCANEDDMYVIAEDFNEAAELLNQWIYL